MERHEHLILAVLLLAGLALRLAGIGHDLPFSYFGDELHLVKRAMAMGSGDLNPHWFHKPALLMYLLLACFGLFFGLGHLAGVYDSPEMFGAAFLADAGPFLLIGRLLVCAIAMLGLWTVYALARRAFGVAAGLVSVAAAALLFPMIVAAQVIKEDLPAGTLLALAMLAYLRSRDDPSWRPLVLAAICAGLSMALKYYGVIVLPVLLAAEVARRWTHDLPWSGVLRRGGLIVAVFLATFVAASPYNLLDPTWGQAMLERLAPFLGEARPVAVNPDTDIAYQPGFAAIPGALAHALGVLFDGKALGPVFGVLAAIGMVAGIWRRESRWAALLLAAPVVIFLLLAATMAPYHSAHRHLNAIYPLLCVFLFPGTTALAGLLRQPRRVALGLGVIAVLAALPAAVQRQIDINRLDSRNVAWAWMRDHLAPGARILADGNGPLLAPDPTAAIRQRTQLEALPLDSPFTHAQGLRLLLLQRYPARQGFNFDELGEPWWLAEEVPAEVLRRSPYHLDMGNPLAVRIPEPLDSYRDRGVRYLVLTDTIARDYGPGTPRHEVFPSYARFLAEVATLAPIQVIDPKTWNGKGPVIRIYDLAAPLTAAAMP